jgi:hypothetical protein
MLEHCVSAFVRLATQLSIFVEGKVPASSNPFRFSERRDGIRLEPLEFFAHDEVIDLRTHAERRNCTAVLWPSFVFHSLAVCGTRVFHGKDTADCSGLSRAGGSKSGRDGDCEGLWVSCQNEIVMDCRPTTFDFETPFSTPCEEEVDGRCHSYVTTILQCAANRGIPSRAFPTPSLSWP